jgi:hypothetical protein
MIAEFRARSARLCRGYEIAPAKRAVIAQQTAQDAHHVEFEPDPVWIRRREECDGAHCSTSNPTETTIICRANSSLFNAARALSIITEDRVGIISEQTDRKIFGTKASELAFLWRLGHRR